MTQHPVITNQTPHAYKVGAPNRLIAVKVVFMLDAVPGTMYEIEDHINVLFHTNTYAVSAQVIGEVENEVRTKVMLHDLETTNEEIQAARLELLQSIADDSPGGTFNYRDDWEEMLRNQILDRRRRDTLAKDAVSDSEANEADEAVFAGLAENDILSKIDPQDGNVSLNPELNAETINASGLQKRLAATLVNYVSDDDRTLNRDEFLRVVMDRIRDDLDAPDGDNLPADFDQAPRKNY